MIARFGWVILVLGAIIGGGLGWLLLPLLVPEDKFFAGVLGVVLIPVAAWIGLLVSYLFARWLEDKSGR